MPVRADGTIPIDDLHAAVKDDDPHFAITRLVTIEKCQERIALLRRQRDDIDSAVEELTRFIDTVKKADAKEKAG